MADLDLAAAVSAAEEAGEVWTATADLAGSPDAARDPEATTRALAELVARAVAAEERLVEGLGRVPRR